MLTAILWTTLIASTVLLIAVASPIRLACKAVYRENGQDNELNAIAHYMHPLILRAEYSSADEQVKFFILGFEKRRGGDKGGDKKDFDNNEIGGIDTEDADTNGIDSTEDIGIGGINTNGINTDDVNTEDIDTEAINNADSDENADTKEKKRSLMSRIKSMVGRIKRRRVYKIISNKSLREKLLRWLKRSFVGAVRTVSFETLKLHIRIGLQDPAALGKMYGYFSATRSALSLRNYRIDLSMEPVFNEMRLDIDSELKIKTTPSIILWRLTLIAATFPYWKIRKIIRN